jgi:hypothetical protein
VTHSARSGGSRLERRHRGQPPPPAPAPGSARPPAPSPARVADPDPPRSGSWLVQVPYWVVVIGVAAGLLWMRGGQRDVRSGTLVMAGVLLAGAAARLGLPERRAGLLGSRRRLADAAAFAALGAGLLVAGLIFPV